MIRFLTLVSLLFAGLEPDVASGDIIVQFENDAAVATDTAVNAAVTHANVSSSALANGSGLSAWGWPDSASPVGFFGNTSLSDAVANNATLVSH